MSQPSQSKQRWLVLNWGNREPLKLSNAVVLRLERKKNPHVLLLNANPFNTEEIDALSSHSIFITSSWNLYDLFTIKLFNVVFLQLFYVICATILC